MKGVCKNCKAAHKACNKKSPCARCIDNNLKCDLLELTDKRNLEIQEIIRETMDEFDDDDEEIEDEVLEDEEEEIEDEEIVEEDETNDTSSSSSKSKSKSNETTPSTPKTKSRGPKKNKRKKRKNWTPIRRKSNISYRILPPDPEPIPEPSPTLPFPITQKLQITDDIQIADESQALQWKDPRVVYHETLPKVVVSEVSVDTDYLRLVGGVEPTWERPSSYIVYQEKTQEEQDDMVEYDMDSEDEQWLSSNPLSEDLFEKAIDRLEKESFLQDSLQAPPFAVDIDVENTNCCICADGTSDDTNQIVFCDGCDIGVHQECYGILCIPEGLWFCARCEARLDTVPCELCTITQGAFKRTTNGKWAHASCAMWIPGCKFTVNEGGMRGDVVLDGVLEEFKNLPCEVCHTDVGACIQCKQCTTTFHVSCAFTAGLYMEVLNETTRRGCCAKHSGVSRRTRQLELEEGTLRKKKEKKKKTPQKKKFLEVFSHEMVTPTQAEKILSPFIPLSHIPSLYEYWKSKRQSRSGNPLLKRLSKNIVYSARSLVLKKNSESTREMREAYRKMRQLRADLEKCRILMECIKKREKHKQQLVVIQKLMFDLKTDPLRPFLGKFLQYMEREDKMGFFSESLKGLKAKLVMTSMEIDVFWDTLESVFTVTNENQVEEANRLSELVRHLRSEVKLSPDFGGDYIAPPKPNPPSPIEEDIEKLIVEVPQVPTRRRSLEDIYMQDTYPYDMLEDDIQDEIHDEIERKVIKKRGRKPKTPKRKKTQNEQLINDIFLIIQKLRAIDKDAIFHEEVEDEQVPGYSQIIKHKMSLATMETKMDEYKSLRQLKDDVKLMVTNCKIFNGPGTIYYKEACKIENIADKLIARAEAGILGQETTTCSICNKSNDKKIIHCGACDKSYHSACLHLKKPIDHFICDSCDISKFCNSCESIKNDKLVVCKGCNKGYHTKCWGVLDESHLPKHMRQYCSSCLHSSFNDFAILCDKCDKPVYQENFVCCEKCEKMYHLQCQNLRNRPESDWQCCNVCNKHKKKDCSKCDVSPKKRLSFTARRRKNLMDSEDEEDSLRGSTSSLTDAISPTITTRISRDEEDEEIDIDT